MHSVCKICSAATDLIPFCSILTQFIRTFSCDFWSYSATDATWNVRKYSTCCKKYFKYSEKYKKWLCYNKKIKCNLLPLPLEIPHWHTGFCQRRMKWINQPSECQIDIIHLKHNFELSLYSFNDKSGSLPCDIFVWALSNHSIILNTFIK